VRKFGPPKGAETGVPTQVIRAPLAAGPGQSPAAGRTLRLDIPLAAVNEAAEFEQSLAA